MLRIHLNQLKARVLQEASNPRSFKISCNCNKMWSRISAEWFATLWRIWRVIILRRCFRNSIVITRQISCPRLFNSKNKTLLRNLQKDVVEQSKRIVAKASTTILLKRTTTRILELTQVAKTRKETQVPVITLAILAPALWYRTQIVSKLSSNQINPCFNQI